MKSFSASVSLVLLLALLLGGCKKDSDIIPSTPAPAPKSIDNSIVSFVFASLSPAITATITGTDLSAVVLANTTLSMLSPIITLPAGATIAPASGVAQNFTNPVSYTVTAENGRTQTYTVTVKHDFQVIVDAKYKALGWTAAPDNGDHAQPTAGGTGWVQYYGNKAQAIYSVSGSAYGMLGDEMKKYDAIGQDKFAILTSDALPTSAGMHYNGFRRVTDGSAGLIVTTPAVGTFLVYGDIYKKYLALNRWDGVLGYPTTDESTNSSGFRYNNFVKNGIAGVIVAGPAGTQAIWGKVYNMWGATGYDTGWLGNPVASSDPAKGDKGQLVNFQHGNVTITDADCGQYNLPNNTRVPVSGIAPPLGNVVLYICY